MVSSINKYKCVKNTFLNWLSGSWELAAAVMFETQLKESEGLTLCFAFRI